MSSNPSSPPWISFRPFSRTVLALPSAPHFSLVSPSESFSALAWENPSASAWGLVSVAASKSVSAKVAGFRFLPSRRSAPVLVSRAQPESELEYSAALLLPTLRCSSKRPSANLSALPRDSRAREREERRDERRRPAQRFARSARLVASRFRFRLRGDADLGDLGALQRVHQRNQLLDRQVAIGPDHDRDLRVGPLQFRQTRHQLGRGHGFVVDLDRLAPVD